jgi:hypothetical protein
MKIYQEMRNPLGIVLHHSETEQGNVESFRRTHKKWGWRDIGYHFVILKDGTIEIGRGLNLKGSHCRGNNKTVGICLVGKLQDKVPTPEQYKSLIRLLTKLCFMYNFSPYEKYTKGKKEGFKISGHRDWCSTDCPGDKFYEMLPRIRDDVKWQLLNSSKVSRLERLCLN